MASQEFKKLQKEIHEQLELKRDSVEVIPLLERLVEMQCTEGFDAYDVEANLALARLYQFYPKGCSFEKVIEMLEKIIILSLMRFPDPDASFFLCMTDERTQEAGELPRLYSLLSLLESGRFAQFWTVHQQQRANFVTVPGFVQTIRKAMLDIVMATFQRIRIDLLGSLLGMKPAEVEEFVNSELSWVLEDNHVRFPLNENNQPKQKTLTELQSLTFDHFSTLLSACK